MRTVIMISFIGSVLLAGLAVAAPGPRGSGRLPKADYDRNAIDEVEPNDSCNQANPLAVGGAVAGVIAFIGDHDWFEVPVQAGQTLHFTTLLSDPDMDTELYVYAADCTTELAYNDDTNGYASYCTYTFDTDGVCYAMVIGYDDDTEGPYILTAEEEASPATLGDTCGDALGLPSGNFVVTGNTTGYTNDYDYDGWGEGSADVVFNFILNDGEWFRCNLVEAESDMVLFLVADCGDIPGTILVTSDDDLEFVYYQNQTGVSQTLYLILDGYGGGDSGAFTMMGENEGGVASQTLTLGAFKTMYR